MHYMYINTENPLNGFHYRIVHYTFVLYISSRILNRIKRKTAALLQCNTSTTYYIKLKNVYYIKSNIIFISKYSMYLLYIKRYTDLHKYIVAVNRSILNELLNYLFFSFFYDVDCYT